MISIHAPRVGSDGHHRRYELRLPISIHAPRVGSDRRRQRGVNGRKYFNPRSPCGERPAESGSVDAGVLFQSTLPVWGATGAGYLVLQGFLISIHAPRVGSDNS